MAKKLESIERIIFNLQRDYTQFTAVALKAELADWGTFIEEKEAEDILDNLVDDGSLEKKVVGKRTLYY